jgi:Tol biopolymer transport system component
MEIFAADPTGRTPVRQVTFARPDGACSSPAACGFADPQPSPDGRLLAYWSTGQPWAARTLWLARANGMQPRSLGPSWDASWSPDSQELADLAPDGLHLVSVARGERIIDRPPTSRGGTLSVRWSPDGRSLAFTDDRGLILRRDGHERLLAGGAPDSLAWSPDGHRIAYQTQMGIFIVSTSGGAARRVYRRVLTTRACWSRSELAYSPDGRFLGFQFGGTAGVLNTRTLRAHAFARSAHDLSWSPDGRSLLYVQGCTSSNGDAEAKGDVQSVTLAGHVQTLVSTAKPYGGQIESAAWTMLPPGVRYRAAQPVSGVFAGGPVQKLAADGERVGYAACGRVAVWDTSSGKTTEVQAAGPCYASFSRSGHVGTLALAGDRILWWDAYTGLGFRWSMYETTLGASPIEVANGYGNLGSVPGDGAGTAVGAGSLLVMSAWTLHHDLDSGHIVVDQQTIERVEPSGCPCAAISTSPGPYTPLDVDDGRVVVSGENETRIIAGDGTILLALPVPTLAAQLSGSQLVIANGDQLRVYDATTGALTATWPLPAAPAGHDCDLYGDPSCNIPSAPVTLEDFAQGLATYVYAGKVYVLRLSNGQDRLVGYGTLARFIDGGLVYADGARIWLTPSTQLP